MSDRLREGITTWVNQAYVNGSLDHHLDDKDKQGSDACVELAIEVAERFAQAEVDKARREAIQKVAKSAKPEKKKDAEYVSMYSYDYVNDGNLDDLCGYVADKSSDWGYNQAIDQYEQNIKELLGGSDE